MPLTMLPVTTGVKNLEFIRLCLNSQLDFLMIGGAAVRFYGCRDEEGLSEIDLLIDHSRENAGKLMTILCQAGITPNFTVDDAQGIQKQLSLKYKSMGYNLDILTSRKEWSACYHDFRERSLSGALGCLQVRFVSKADLIVLKQNALTVLASDLTQYPETRVIAQIEKHKKDLLCLQALAA